jgi:sec-independent protein translocase protein TatB
VIAMVALLVLGPERLPRAARFAGLWVRRARAQWHSVRAELERDLAAEELQRSLRDSGAAMREAQAALRAEADALMRGPDPGAAAAGSEPREGGDADGSR